MVSASPREFLCIGLSILDIDWLIHRMPHTFSPVLQLSPRDIPNIGKQRYQSAGEDPGRNRFDPFERFTGCNTVSPDQCSSEDDHAQKRCRR